MPPERVTVPAAGSASPARTLVSVVLPAPLRPTRPTRSPAAIRKETSDIRIREPARSSIPVAVIKGALRYDGTTGGQKRWPGRRHGQPLARQGVRRSITRTVYASAHGPLH